MDAVLEQEEELKSITVQEPKDVYRMGTRTVATKMNEGPVKRSWVKRWKRNLGKRMMTKKSDRVYLPFYMRLLDVLKGA